MALVPLPQFIEKESKLIGPLTFKQFIYVMVVVAVCIVIFVSVPRAIFFPLLIIIVISAILSLFVKIEGLPFPVFLFLNLKTLVSSKTFVWGGKGKRPLSLQEIEVKKIEKNQIKTRRESVLKKRILQIETKK